MNNYHLWQDGLGFWYIQNGEKIARLYFAPFTSEDDVRESIDNIVNILESEDE